MNAELTGQLIAVRRRELGLPQTELAEQLHVTDKAVSRWETGRGMPSVDLLEPLADALGLSVSELLSGACVRGVNAAQAGKVLAKLAKTDSRVQMKNVHNVRQYRLPPLCATDFYHHTDDYVPPLTG